MSLDPEQFQELRSIVRTEVSRVMAEQMSPWRDRQGAAAYLQCGVTKIDELTADGTLKRSFFVNGRPRYAVEDLDKLITGERTG